MRKNIIISIIANILLLLGCLYFSYHWLDSYIRSAYRYDSLSAMSDNIVQQKFLLKTILQNSSREEFLILAQKTVEQLEGCDAQLIINSDSIVFDETKILFEHDKVVDVE